MKRYTSDIAIVGAGPAGLMAAITAASGGRQVIILERNDICGKKLLITGKGRCNLTNDCDAQQVMANIPTNPKFMYSSLSEFGPREVIDFFEALGLNTKTERGGRVFPTSDKAADVAAALTGEIKRLGIRVVNARVKKILTENGAVTGLSAPGIELSCQSVIIATGGGSYPRTGSTGDGYAMAKELGHRVIEPKPSLVPLEEDGSFCQRMQGLSLKNAALELIDQKGKTVFSDFGELMFTHFGLSGPMTLSASAHMGEGEGYTVKIDLKPALDEQALDARLLRDFDKFCNRRFSNALDELLPRLMIPVIVERSGIGGDTVVNSITRAQRHRLIRLLKGFEIKIRRKRPLDEAIITSGGVKTSEISPRTMESKLVSGLYFAGEVIDVDAYTGGYNLQIAWSTGRAAGQNA